MEPNFFQHYGDTLREQAKELRKNPTEPERKLWFSFLCRQTPRFFYQKIIGPYILDFYCPALHLAIELDGDTHAEQEFYDRERTTYLQTQGIRVIRFANAEVMRNFSDVCAKIHQEQRNSPMKTVTIYTDGACSGNPGPGGWGAILSYNGQEKELSGGEPETTNNRMELTGVIQALSALKEPCTVELYSDSKYVIDALQKGWVWGWKKKGWIKSDKKPALNVDLWEQLLPLVQKHELHYHWVKGHAANEKNNRCDELAVAESRKFK